MFKYMFLTAPIKFFLLLDLTIKNEFYFEINWYVYFPSETRKQVFTAAACKPADCGAHIFLFKQISG